ncbi:FtsB family cell division protein [Microbacterium sp. gxy059]|uniref:FtsB family cell division protein n=1 Tax=Microbacterium sp. gxy059 TaxID=2957199 RepID=UPI003D96B9A9
MRRPAAPSSRPPQPRPSRSERASGRASRGGSATVDPRDWLGSIRLSWFAVIMLALVVMAVLVLVPSVGGYLELRQQIRAAEHSVQVTKDEIAELQREKERWRDPAYITSQARERLYYMMPGEVVYLIDDDLDHSEDPEDPAPVSAEVEEKRSDWTGFLLRSVANAGLAQQAVPEEPADGGVFAPDPEPTETPG